MFSLPLLFPGRRFKRKTILGRGIDRRSLSNRGIRLSCRLCFVLEDRSLAQTTPPTRYKLRAQKCSIRDSRRGRRLIVPRASVCFHPPESSSEASRARFRERGENQLAGNAGFIPSDSPRVAMVARSGGLHHHPRNFSLSGEGI